MCWRSPHLPRYNPREQVENAAHSGAFSQKFSKRTDVEWRFLYFFSPETNDHSHFTWNVSINFTPNLGLWNIACVQPIAEKASPSFLPLLQKLTWNLPNNYGKQLSKETIEVFTSCNNWINVRSAFGKPRPAATKLKWSPNCQWLLREFRQPRGSAMPLSELTLFHC